MDHPSVYAIVLNYCGAEDTIQCVKSLQGCGYANLTIVLVDNASPDGSSDILASAFPDITLIREKHNTGYAGGNNTGIRYALGKRADYVLILNNDVVVEHGFLEPMLVLMNRDQQIGVVNAKVFYTSEPDEVFSAAGQFSRILCTGLNKNLNEDVCRSSTLECEVDYICGVLLLVRSDVFLSVGLLDDRFFMYFEDIEFSRRVKVRYSLAYTARAVAYHKSGGGKGWRSYTELYLYYHTRNRIWVFQHEPLWYRIYVVLFTFMNSVAKAAIISLNVLHDCRGTFKQWKALARGFIDGLKASNHPPTAMTKLSSQHTSQVNVQLFKKDKNEG
ncbi:MAG: glycosyltransferase family 2 protein [Bacteroidetes bacterium]|nr:glycosyltransferase family 2 protein [Bacteroidota bacterium]MCW5895356.1 glycosyltransferase family 2 protein [Bacteroidota bacterium]